MSEQTIGIPQALIFFKYPSFWQVLLKDLGFKVILSPKTNRQIMENGCKIAETESCLSFKVYQGHVDYLINQVKPDYILAPRIISLRDKHLSCPKFFGLPDLVKLQGHNLKILEPEFDFNKQSFKQTVFDLALSLGKNRQQIEKAYQIALKIEIEDWRKKAEQYFEKIKSSKKKIVLISHPYTLFDDYVNLNIRKKLAANNVEPIDIDSVPFDFEATFCHWDFESELLNQVRQVLKEKIDAAIQLSTFNCGCDSVVKEFVLDEFKKAAVPYLSLIIDEHTGEAGLLTRIEAFLDTLK